MALFGLGKPNVEKMGAKKDVDGLIKALAYQGDLEVRWNAAAALGKIGEPRAVDALIVALRDPGHSFIRMNAAAALGKIGEPRAVDALIAALADSDARVESYAARALGSIGDKGAADALANATKAPYKDVRLSAAASLGKLNDPRAFDTLLGFLSSPKEAADVKKLAIQELGHIAGARAVDPIISASLQYNSLRDDAKKALIQIGSPAVGPLKAVMINSADNDRSIFDWAGSTLAGIGWQPEKDAASIYYIIYMHDYLKCVEIGEPAVEPLLQQIDVGKRRVAQELVSVLLLIYAKLDSDASRRRIEDMFVSVLRAGEYWVRWKDRAAQDLCSTQDAWPESLFTLALGSDDRTVRAHAAEVLGNIGNPIAIGLLLKALKDKEDLVRSASSAALSKMGASAIEPLKLALLEGAPAYAPMAVKVLDELKWKPGYDAAGAYYWLAKGQLDKCIAIGESAIEPLIKYLNSGSEDAEMIERAVASLDPKLGYQVTEGRSIGWIRKSLASPDYWACEQAISDLGKIGNDEAVDALVAVMNWYLGETAYHQRNLAIRTLGEMGSRRALDVLINTLYIDQYDLRENVAHTLVAMYRSEKLDDESKLRILACRPKIIEPRIHNYVGGYSESTGQSNDCSHNDSRVHDDRGIGIDFPI